MNCTFLLFIAVAVLNRDLHIKSVKAKSSKKDSVALCKDGQPPFKDPAASCAKRCTEGANDDCPSGRKCTTTSVPGVFGCCKVGSDGNESQPKDKPPKRLRMNMGQWTAANPFGNIPAYGQPHQCPPGLVPYVPQGTASACPCNFNWHCPPGFQCYLKTPISAANPNRCGVCCQNFVGPGSAVESGPLTPFLPNVGPGGTPLGGFASSGNANFPPGGSPLVSMVPMQVPRPISAPVPFRFTSGGFDKSDSGSSAGSDLTPASSSSSTNTLGSNGRNQIIVVPSGTATKINLGAGKVLEGEEVLDVFGPDGKFIGYIKPSDAQPVPASASENLPRSASSLSIIRGMSSPGIAIYNASTGGLRPSMGNQGGINVIIVNPGASRPLKPDEFPDDDGPKADFIDNLSKSLQPELEALLQSSNNGERDDGLSLKVETFPDDKDYPPGTIMANPLVPVHAPPTPYRKGLSDWQQYNSGSSSSTNRQNLAALLKANGYTVESSNLPETFARDSNSAGASVGNGNRISADRANKHRGKNANRDIDGSKGKSKNEQASNNPNVDNGVSLFSVSSPQLKNNKNNAGNNQRGNYPEKSTTVSKYLLSQEELNNLIANSNKESLSIPEYKTNNMVNSRFVKSGGGETFDENRNSNRNRQNEFDRLTNSHRENGRKPHAPAGVPESSEEENSVYEIINPASYTSAKHENEKSNNLAVYRGSSSSNAMPQKESSDKHSKKPCTKKHAADESGEDDEKLCPCGSPPYIAPGATQPLTCTELNSNAQCPSSYTCTELECGDCFCCPTDHGLCPGTNAKPYTSMFNDKPHECSFDSPSSCPSGYNCVPSTTGQRVCCIAQSRLHHAANKATRKPSHGRTRKPRQ